MSNNITDETTNLTVDEFIKKYCNWSGIMYGPSHGSEPCQCKFCREGKW